MTLNQLTGMSATIEFQDLKNFVDRSDCLPRHLPIKIEPCHHRGD